MHRTADNWSWTEAPTEVIDESSTGIWSGDGTRASGASRSTFFSHESKVAVSVAISATSSQERRDSLCSDLSSLSKSSVMGFDDLFDDSKRPQLARWHSNDMLFDQSIFPACPVRRASLVTNERLKPARWSSGQVLSMPPKPRRKFPLSPQSKMPSPNAKKIPSRRQKVKRAPSRVKSHGSFLTSHTSSISNVSKDDSLNEIKRWALSEGLNASSQHLPAKPTRRSSVVHTPTNGRTNEGAALEASSPASFASTVEHPSTGQLSTLRDSTPHKPIDRSHSCSEAHRRNVRKPEVSKIGGDVPTRQVTSYSERRNRSYRKSLFGDKRSISGHSIRSGDSPSDCGSTLSKLSADQSFGGYSKAADQCSVASASEGSGPIMGAGINVSQPKAPALGKEVQQIRRWANTA